MLSDSESEGEPVHDLTINEHYAKAFAYRKEREELERLKEKYGSDVEGDSDASSETDSEDEVSEDEDGDELTPALDAAILRTLARIKRKDPSIYNTDQDIFQEEQKKIGSFGPLARAPPRDKSKPVTMRQVMLDSALNPDSRSPSPQPLPHVEEQRALRSETIAAFHGAVGGATRGGGDDSDAGIGEDEDDGFLVPREKSKDELLREEEEYRAFLEREVGDDLADLVTVEEGGSVFVAEEEPSKKKKRRKKEKESAESKTQEDQEFLMNYILNRGWIDPSTRRVPTYGEITGAKGAKKAKIGSPTVDGDNVDQDDSGEDTNDEKLDEDDFDEIVDRFESSYNFRFEEPDSAVIKSYPRLLSSVVRRQDTVRKEARERRKQRKEVEKAQKKEEVKRLKSLKMKELRAKLERIGHEGGKKVDESQALQELDLDGEWDPEAHDKQMAQIYDDDDDHVDDEKPQWDDDIDIGDIVTPDAETAKKAKKKKKKKKGKGEDDVDDAEMNAADDEQWDGTDEMRKRKLDEYMDEVYDLDFNDIVGDLPTHFRYATVQPQSFSLAPTDILTATDAELNQYLSVKKYAPYRQDRRWDSSRGERLKELKQKVSERLTGVGEAPPPAKKRMGKKERLKMRALGGVPDLEEGAAAPGTERKPDEVVGERRRQLDGGVGDSGEREGGESGSRKRRRRQNKSTVHEGGS